MTPAGAAALAFCSRVLKVREEGPACRTFRLQVPEDFAFRPGMWVMVAFPDEPKVSRAYSISSSPLEKGGIEISLNRVGRFTSRMFGLREGDLLSVRGPYGKWFYRDEDDPAVLISGGSGLAPFRSMGRYVLDKGLPNRLSILYSSKTPGDILYRRELDDFRRRGIRVYVTITRPDALSAGEAWDGPTGRLDVETVRREVPDFEKACYYLCGPISLVEGFTRGLLERGIDRARIRYEKWGEY